MPYFKDVWILLLVSRFHGITLLFLFINVVWATLTRFFLSSSCFVWIQSTNFQEIALTNIDQSYPTKRHVWLDHLLIADKIQEINIHDSHFTTIPAKPDLFWCVFEGVYSQCDHNTKMKSRHNHCGKFWQVFL